MDKKICKFFLKDSCKIGKNCKFSHDIKENNYNKEKIHSSKTNFQTKILTKSINDLNLKRKNKYIPTLEVSFIETINDKFIIFFYNKNFAWLYNYKDNEFEDDQLFFNKKIKNGIYLIFKGKFGVLGDTLSMAFNYYNEFKMERKSCI